MKLHRVVFGSCSTSLGQKVIGKVNYRLSTDAEVSLKLWPLTVYFLEFRQYSHSSLVKADLTNVGS